MFQKIMFASHEQPRDRIRKSANPITCNRAITAYDSRNRQNDFFTKSELLLNKRESSIWLAGAD